MQDLPCLSPFTDSTYPPNQPPQLVFHQFSPQPRSGPLQAPGPPRGPPRSPHATESSYASHVPIFILEALYALNTSIAHHSHGKIQTRYPTHYNESHPCSTSAIPYRNAIIHDDKDDVTPSSLHPALTLAAPIQSDPIQLIPY